LWQEKKKKIIIGEKVRFCGYPHGAIVQEDQRIESLGLKPKGHRNAFGRS